MDFLGLCRYCLDKDIINKQLELETRKTDEQYDIDKKNNYKNNRQCKKKEKIKSIDTQNSTNKSENDHNEEKENNIIFDLEKKERKSNFFITLNSQMDFFSEIQEKDDKLEEDVKDSNLKIIEIEEEKKQEKILLEEEKKSDDQKKKVERSIKLIFYDIKRKKEFPIYLNLLLSDKFSLIVDELIGLYPELKNDNIQNFSFNDKNIERSQKIESITGLFDNSIIYIN